MNLYFILTLLTFIQLTSASGMDKPYISFEYRVGANGSLAATLECMPSTDLSPLTSIKYKWYKNNKELILPDAVSKTHLLDVFEQKDNFSCSSTYFSNDTQHTFTNKSQEYPIAVLNAPTLDVLSSQWPLSSGNSVALKCNINFIGNISVLYQFIKEDVKITSFESNGVISFNSMQSNVSGSYRCASKVNGNLKTSINATLTVNLLAGIHVDRDHAILEGSDKNITCFVHGGEAIFNVTWRKNNLLLPLETSTNILLKNISRKDTISCSVTSSLTHLRSNEATLKLNITYIADNLSITPDFVSKRVRNNYTGLVRCSSTDYGEPKSILSWFRNNDDIIIGKKGEPVDLRLDSLNQNYTGNYTCKAVNAIGEVTSKTFELIVLETPDAPQSLQMVKVTNNSITIKWSAPLFNGNVAIQTYNLIYREKSISTFINVIGLSNSNLSYIITSLSPGVTYEIKVQAVNNIGDGFATKLIEVKTKSVPSAPNGFKQVLPRTKQSISLTWNSLLSTDGVILNYTVCYNKTYGITINGVTKCVTISGLNTSLTIKNLGKFSGYDVNVAASNIYGFGTKATLNNIFTAKEAPPPLASSLLPKPPKDRINKHLFAINIVLFNESYGRISHYDVIVFKQDNDVVNTRHPNAYSNAEISNNVVGRLVKPNANQLFFVGDSSRRKRRSLGTPNNPLLKPGSFYAVFVRGYVSNSEYQSTSWYKIVKTHDDSKGGRVNAAIAIAVPIGILLIMVGFMYIMSRNKKKKKAESLELSGKGKTPPLDNQ